MKTTAFEKVLNINFDNIINEIIEFTKYQYPLYKDKVIAIPISFFASDYIKKTVRKSFTLLYHSPNNYTKVCWSTDDPVELIYSGYSSTTVNFVTDHDSCWRDGTSRTLREFAEQFVEEVENTFSSRELNSGKIDISANLSHSGIKYIDAVLGMSKQECMETGKSVLIKKAK